MQTPTLNAATAAWPALRAVIGKARVGVFFVVRTATWLFLLTPHGWAGGDPSPGRLATVLGGLVLDVLITQAIRRGPSDLMVLRVGYSLLLVAGLAATWPNAEPPTAAALLAAPMLVELTVLRGLLQGAALTAAFSAAMIAARLAAGLETFAADTIFNLALILVTAFPLGVIIRLGLVRHWERHHEEQDAAAALAELQARSDVALRRGSMAAENLYRAWFLLESVGVKGARGERLRQQAEREEVIARSTISAAYLKQALAAYAAAQRADQPDVRAQLLFDLVPEAGLILLSQDQVQDLYRALDQMSLEARGELVPADAQETDGTVTVTVDGRPIILPPTRRRLLSFRLLAVLVGAVLVLTLANPAYSRLPLLGVIGLALATGAAGIWLDGRGDPDHRQAAWTALTLLPVVGASLLQLDPDTRWVLDNGRVMIPMLGGINATAMIAGVIWSRLRGAPRLAIATTVAACLVATLTMSPSGAPAWLDVVAELVWPTETFALVALMSSLTLRLDRELAQAWSRESSHTVSRVRQEHYLAALSSLDLTVGRAEQLTAEAPATPEVTVARRLLAEARADLRDAVEAASAAGGDPA